MSLYDFICFISKKSKSRGISYICWGLKADSLVAMIQWALCILEFSQAKDRNILEGKASECSKNQNLNLLRDGNYLHIIYITLGIISNLEMIYHIWEVVCRLDVGIHRGPGMTPREYWGMTLITMQWDLLLNLKLDCF